MTQIKTGDTIVFDSVSRMSRNAGEGYNDYKTLYSMGVNLIFLNKPLINTSVFDSTRNNLLNINIETGNTIIDQLISKDILPHALRRPRIRGPCSRQVFDRLRTSLFLRFSKW